MEFRAVELCQQIASPKVIDLAIKYAARNGKMALANKLESIGDNKIQEQAKQELEKAENDKMTNEIVVEEEEEEPILPVLMKKPEIEIRPLTYSQGMMKRNPFKKTKKPPEVTGLLALDTRDEPKKLPITSPILQKIKKPSIKTKEKLPTKKESYVKWYVRNKKKLEEEFPGMNATELTAKCLEKYRNMPDDVDSTKDDNEETKKRKLSETDETMPVSEAKKSTSSKLAAFARKDEN